MLNDAFSNEKQYFNINPYADQIRLDFDIDTVRQF